MRQVTRPPQTTLPPRDPAPTILAYRLQRVWLTPGYRRLCRLGLPLAVTALAVTGWFWDPARQVAAANMWIDARRVIEERPEFMVKLMAVDGASEALAADIRASVPLDFPMSSFDIDLETVRSRVETLPAVARAKVKIVGGGTLKIAVTERVPALVWRSGEGLWLLDETGHPVAPLAARADRADLPLVAGPGAPEAADEALELIAAAQPLGLRQRGLLRRGERRWDLILDRGQRIMLPEVAPIDALERLIALEQAETMLERDLTVVDFRNPRRPTLRLAENAVEELRRIKGYKRQAGE